MICLIVDKGSTPFINLRLKRSGYRKSKLHYGLYFNKYSGILVGYLYVSIVGFTLNIESYI